MKFFFLFLISALGFTLCAQSTYYNKTYAAPNINLSVGVTQVDSSYYVVGQQRTPTNKKMTLDHIDKFGNLIQSVSYEVDTLNFFSQKIQCQNNNIFVYGSFQQINPAYPDNSKIFLASYTKNLQLNWIKTYGGNFYNSGTDFKITKDQGFIMTGSTTNGVGENFHEQAILIKTDSLGNVEWQKQFGEQLKQEVLETVSVNDDGSFLLSGYARSFIPDLMLSYFLRVNPEGELIWKKTYGNEFGSFSGSISQFSDSVAILIGTNKTNNLGFYNFNGYFLKIDYFTGEIFTSKELFYEPYTNFHSNYILDKDSAIVFITDQIDSNNLNYISLLKLNQYGEEIWKRDYFTNKNKRQYIYNIQQTKDGGYVMCGSAFDTTSYQRAWVIKTDCYGYDSVTYYFKDSICNVEDCKRYENDFSLNVFQDSLDLHQGAMLLANATLQEDATLTWYFGDGNSEVNQLDISYLYKNPGLYELQLFFEKGMCILSKRKQIKAVKPNLEDSFGLYPNPNDGTFTLLHYFEKQVNLQITNALGQEILKRELLNSLESIHLLLASGIYVVSLEHEGKVYQQKMVISR